MNPLRPVVLHAGLFVVAGLSATFVWSKEKTPRGAQEAATTVWNARPSDVQRLVYESKGKRVELESREEKKGERWFFGTSRQAPVAAGDAGAPPAAPKSTVFVSVAVAGKIADAFAPFKAVRALGKIPESRASEFGFEKEEGTLSLAIGGKERKLRLGATSPGGTDTYVLDTENQEAYVIKSEPIHDFESGEARLMERDQHAFKENEITAAKVVVGPKARQLVRGGAEGKKIWADPSDREKADETAGNWLQKIDRLRVIEYAAKPPEGRTLVARVEYEGGSKNLGFFELAKTPPTGDEKKGEYWILTEHTHLYGKVHAGSAEQIEQDVSSVVK